MHPVRGDRGPHSPRTRCVLRALPGSCPQRLTPSLHGQSSEEPPVICAGTLSPERWLPQAPQPASRWRGWDSNPGSLALKPIVFPLSQAASAESPARWLWVLLCSLSYPGVSAVMACHVVGVRQVAAGRNSKYWSFRGRVRRKHSRGAQGGGASAALRGCRVGGVDAGGGSCVTNPAQLSGEAVHSQPQGKPLTSGILIHPSLPFPPPSL